MAHVGGIYLAACGASISRNVCVACHSVVIIHARNYIEENYVKSFKAFCYVTNTERLVSYAKLLYRCFMYSKIEAKYFSENSLSIHHIPHTVGSL